MIDDLLWLVGDVLLDFLESFRNGRFNYKEWTAKLVMRLIMVLLILLFGLAYVRGVQADSGILKLIGIAGIVAAMIGMWRLETIWHQESMESRHNHKKEDLEKASD